MGKQRSPCLTSVTAPKRPRDGQARDSGRVPQFGLPRARHVLCAHELGHTASGGSPQPKLAPASASLLPVSPRKENRSQPMKKNDWVSTGYLRPAVR